MNETSQQKEYSLTKYNPDIKPLLCCCQWWSWGIGILVLLMLYMQII